MSETRYIVLSEQRWIELTVDNAVGVFYAQPYELEQAQDIARGAAESMPMVVLKVAPVARFSSVTAVTHTKLE